MVKKNSSYGAYNNLTKVVGAARLGTSVLGTARKGLSRALTGPEGRYEDNRSYLARAFGSGSSCRSPDDESGRDVSPSTDMAELLEED
ncbi:MAG: hypothetical protein ABEJ03_01855 [Candidatus Nanohaloarchaea archaeon]